MRPRDKQSSTEQLSLIIPSVDSVRGRRINTLLSPPSVGGANKNVYVFVAYGKWGKLRT